MLRSTERVLNAIAKDMRDGLLETVGVESRLSLEEGKCSMVLKLPPETDMQRVAQAIDLENVEAWCDSKNNVNIAVNPWYSTKDVDQAVLCAIKVIHVMLGLHADDESTPMSFKQKLFKLISEIMQIQQSARK